MNNVVLIGRLTKDPELKFTPGSGTAVCNITIAVDRRLPNKNGEKEADFIPVIIWGKQAEATANYMTKGRAICVRGRIQTRSYEAKDGTKRYVTEIIAEEVIFLGSKKDSNGGNSNRSSMNTYNDSDSSYFDDEMTPIDDGEIPF